MGKIGRYIDALPDRARDRIIEGQGWRDEVAVDRHGDRCLVGHAEDWRAGELDPRDLAVAKLSGGTQPETGMCVGDYFDRACARFGLARVVRACKLRAASPPIRAAVRAAIRDVRRAAKEASDV